MRNAGLSEADRGQRLSRNLPAPLRRLARRYSDWNFGWQADIALRYVPVADALSSRLPRSSETSEVWPSDARSSRLPRSSETSEVWPSDARSSRLPRSSETSEGWPSDARSSRLPRSSETSEVWPSDAPSIRPPRSQKTSEVERQVERQVERAAERIAGVVLDVGCGSKGGVTSYVPVRTVGVDLAFNVGRIRRHPAVTPVLGSGLALPIANASVDVALCMDTLEHLAPAERSQLVAELFRVVVDRGMVIAGAPCGLEARQVEEAVNARYRERTGRDHPWLAEHLEHEPLTPQALAELMASAASRRFARFDLELVPNTNLALWRRLQEQGALRHVHRLLFQPLWPFIRNRHELPAYRQVCIVRAKL